MFCCSYESIEHKARRRYRTTTDKEAIAPSNSSCHLLSKGIADSSHAVAIFVGAWIKIKIMFGLFSVLNDKFLKFDQSKTGGFDDKGRQFQKQIDEVLSLKGSCVARVICLSNQEATHQKSPISSVVAEALR